MMTRLQILARFTQYLILWLFSYIVLLLQFLKQTKYDILVMEEKCSLLCTLVLERSSILTGVCTLGTLLAYPCLHYLP